MKKLLLLISLISFVSTIAVAQCIPIPVPGTALSNPESEINNAAATQFYSQVIHISVPADTVMPPIVFPITIDSAGIVSISGLPNGFSYQTNSSNDIWPGDTTGCVLLQGMPTAAEIGTYTLSVEYIVYALGQAATDILYYDFEVLDSTHVGFDKVTEHGFGLKQNMPNPANENTQIDFFSENEKTLEFSIYNVQGQLVDKRVIQAKKGVNSISVNTSRYASGIYVYRLNDGIVSDSKRMIIQ